jgi:hypothetical protein
MSEDSRVVTVYVVMNLPPGGWNHRVEHGVFFSREEAESLQKRLPHSRIRERKAIQLNGDWRYVSTPITNIKKQDRIQETKKIPAKDVSSQDVAEFIADYEKAEKMPMFAPRKK